MEDFLPNFLELVRADTPTLLTAEDGYYQPSFAVTFQFWMEKAVALPLCFFQFVQPATTFLVSLSLA